MKVSYCMNHRITLFEIDDRFGTIVFYKNKKSRHQLIVLEYEIKALIYAITMDKILCTILYDRKMNFPKTSCTIPNELTKLVFRGITKLWGPIIFFQTGHFPLRKSRKH